MAVGVVALAAMEPVTAALHRFVFHGRGYVLHRSHHRGGRGRFEANDVYPVVLAALTIVAMAVGSQGGRLSVLLPAGAGVTPYGLAYLVVHDLYIHRRLPLLPPRLALLEPLADAHRIHHRHGGAPYGMLCPVVPARLRGRPESPNRGRGDTGGDTEAANRSAPAGAPAHDPSAAVEATATRRRSRVAATGASRRAATDTLRGVGTRTRRVKTS
jgi:beta-carotene 3-hydroxylase